MLLQHNKISSLSLQTEDGEFITDSLHLLKYIEELNISSNAIFSGPARKETIALKFGPVTKLIEVNFYGKYSKLVS